MARDIDLETGDSFEQLRAEGGVMGSARMAGHSLRWFDAAALLLGLFGVVATYLIGLRVFEHIPHLEDEFAYVWQAQAIAGGRATLETPPHAKHFIVPFVVDVNGQRFGKYPLGWPALLGLGERLGQPGLVNPLLAGLGIWLTYLLGKRLFNPGLGLLAAVLTLTSPFFLLNSSAFLSHPLGLVLSAAFALFWLDSFLLGAARPRLAVLGAAFALGGLAITRPLTALGVAAPFMVHGLVLLVRGDPPVRRRLAAFIGMVAAIASLQFLWQYAASGDPFLNLYTLWWEYDKVGFGPGVGRYDHNLSLAYHNLKISLQAGVSDLFGWGRISWIFLPFGVWTLVRRRHWGALLAGTVFFSLVGTYLFYWIGAWLFGPRYYYEGLYSLTLLTAAGIATLAGWPLGEARKPRRRGRQDRLRALGMTALVAFLISLNLIFYAPQRLGGMFGLYGIDRSRLAPFAAAAGQGLTPALVIVHPDHWTEYGALLPLQTPYLDTPFLTAWSRGPAADRALAETFSDRQLYHYFPDDPFRFVVPQP